jgi:hypothetical protein
MRLPTRFRLISNLLQCFVCVAAALVCPQEFSDVFEASNSVKLPTLLLPASNSKRSTVAAAIEIYRSFDRRPATVRARKKLFLQPNSLSFPVATISFFPLMLRRSSSSSMSNSTPPPWRLPLFVRPTFSPLSSLDPETVRFPWRVFGGYADFGRAVRTGSLRSLQVLRLPRPGREIPAEQMRKNMPAARRKNAHDIFEIDTRAPFDPDRYFTVLRSTGNNPFILRTTDNGVQLNLEVWREQSPLERKRVEAASAWANQQDPDRSLQRAFLMKIANDLPLGGIAYLG